MVHELPFAGDNRKRFKQGTHRERHPDVTWATIVDMLPSFGITRVADVTGLDWLGVPVAVAVRPLSQTLAVSQGKGLSQTLARVGAVMESVELWHAEQFRPAEAVRGPASDLNLPYDLFGLQQRPGSLLTERWVLDWTIATGLLSGEPAFVPVDAVRLSFTLSERLPAMGPNGLFSSSNGLASGNSVAEAALHGLYELLERHIISSCGRDDIFSIDRASLCDRVAGTVLQPVILDAAVQLEVQGIRNALGIPCYRACLTTHDFPLLALGSGSHSDPSVALSRAITEAAQSRLTEIVGTRDDIDEASYRSVGALFPSEVSDAKLILESDLAWNSAYGDEDIGQEVRSVARAVVSLTGVEPLAVTLSDPTSPIAVVKVVAPGLAYNAERTHTPQL